LIREFVKRGGGLVITGGTATFNEWRQRRREPGLKDLDGAERVVSVQAIQPATPKPPPASATSGYWKLPVNWAELVAGVRRAAGGSLSVDVKAPLTVTAEVHEQKQKRRTLVHLVNYDPARSPQVRNIQVSLAVPAGAAVENASLLSPDEDKPASLSCAMRNGRAEFNVPRLGTYSVAVIQWK
jgi:hypothetical protein